MAQKYRVSPTVTDIPKWVREAAQSLNSFLRESSDTNDGITAGTVQTQAGATALKLGTNRVSTANTNDGVLLPFSTGGGECVIRNDGGAAVKIWPQTGASIDGGSANAADSNVLPNGAARSYRAMSSTTWYTIGNS